MNKYKRCLRCGRKLKTDNAQTIGFGKICFEKHLSEAKYKELFKIERSECEKLDG